MNERKEFSHVERRFKPVSNSTTFNRILRIIGLNKKKVLDIGCGWGEYLVKFGKGSLGITSTLEEVEYGKTKGIRIQKGNAEVIDKLELNEYFEAIWANNLFEHLLSPHSFLMRLKSISDSRTILILGVPVIPKFASLMRFPAFRGALASPHINFFTRESLKLTVEFGGWNVESLRPFIFSNSLLDSIAAFFAPHLYIVAHNDASYRYPDKKVKEWKSESYYHELLRYGNRAVILEE